MARVRGALLFGLAALALAGCSSASDAAPPPVRLDDLNLRPYLAKPCALLTADQLADLGIAKAEIDGPQSDEIATCSLTLSPTTSGDLRLGVNRPSPSPTTRKIAGYPAAEGPTDTGCAVRVDVATSQQLVVTIGGPNACHLAESVATSAIGTIKRESP